MRASPDEEQALTIWEAGRHYPNHLRLTTHHGIGELDFRIALAFRVSAIGARAYTAYATRYQYLVSDIAEREVLIYDWHPIGASPVTTPHLHVPAAGAMTLAQREGSPLAEVKTQLGSLHLPTGPITLATVIDMLIREFHVDAARADWERVLPDA